MIKEIIRDINFLKIPSTPITSNDLYIIDDLIDTLNIHQDTCVGMAANMIGYNKSAIIIRLDNDEILVMINPKIIEKKDSYKVKEGCLSLEGQRETIRYKKIKVQWYTKDFKIKIKTFKNFEAEIIQHEIDHLFGIII